MVPGICLAEAKAYTVNVRVCPAGKTSTVYGMDHIVGFAVHHMPIHIGKIARLHDTLEVLILFIVRPLLVKVSSIASTVRPISALEVNTPYNLQPIEYCRTISGNISSRFFSSGT